jgi:hypothetical protein
MFPYQTQADGPVKITGGGASFLQGQGTGFRFQVSGFRLRRKEKGWRIEDN